MTALTPAFSWKTTVSGRPRAGFPRSPSSCTRQRQAGPGAARARWPPQLWGGPSTPGRWARAALWFWPTSPLEVGINITRAGRRPGAGETRSYVRVPAVCLVLQADAPSSVGMGSLVSNGAQVEVPPGPCPCPHYGCRGLCQPRHGSRFSVLPG